MNLSSCCCFPLLRSIVHPYHTKMPCRKPVYDDNTRLGVKFRSRHNQYYSLLTGITARGWVRGPRGRRRRSTTSIGGCSRARGIRGEDTKVSINMEFERLLTNSQACRKDGVIFVLANCETNIFQPHDGSSRKICFNFRPTRRTGAEPPGGICAPNSPRHCAVNRPSVKSPKMLLCH